MGVHRVGWSLPPLLSSQVPLSQLAYGPSPPPQILYNPAQQILAYTGLCPPSMTVPTCSSYPLPLQVGKFTCPGQAVVISVGFQVDRVGL